MKRALCLILTTTLGCSHIGQFIENIDGTIGKVITPYPTSKTYRPGATAQ